jgi:hypothetical protein
MQCFTELKQVVGFKGLKGTFTFKVWRKVRFKFWKYRVIGNGRDQWGGLN